jgi:hypothetical protein
MSVFQEYVTDLTHRNILLGNSTYLPFQDEKINNHFIVRFAIRDWIDGYTFYREIVKISQIFSMSLCTSSNMKEYNIISICYQKLTSGLIIPFYDPTSLLYWEGYNDKFISSSEGDFIVDMVFKLKSNVSKVDFNAKLISENLTNSLRYLSPKGKPDVHVGAFVWLEDILDSDKKAQDGRPVGQMLYDYYRKMIPFWEIEFDKEINDCEWRQINKNSKAFEHFPKHIGSDGKGFALGSAFDPFYLNAAPLPQGGTPEEMTIVDMESGQSRQWTTPGVEKEKKEEWKFESVPDTYKIGGMVAGLALYLILKKKFFY